MKRLLVVLSIVALGVCWLSPPVAADATWPFEFARIEYGVLTPPHTDVKWDKMFDFDIYHFVFNGHTILNAYVGNNPEYPSISKRWISSKNRDSVNGLPAETILSKSSSATRSRETLITLNLGSHICCQYIHFYYESDSKADAAKAVRIIASLDSLLPKWPKASNPPR
jgi:hypothetical protein